jgi:hypothetical protein
LERGALIHFAGSSCRSHPSEAICACIDLQRRPDAVVGGAFATTSRTYDESAASRSSSPQTWG